MEAVGAANRQNINNSNAIFYVSFGVCLLLYLSTYLIGSNDVADQALPAAAVPPLNAESPADALPAPPRNGDAARIKRPPPPPPSTPASHHVTHILPALIADYEIESGGCWPTDIDKPDKHRLPPPLAAPARPVEPKSAMVVYVAVALLLMSLAATLVDFCKAKSIRARNC